MDYEQKNSNMQNPYMQGNGENRGGLFTAARICGIVSISLGLLSLIACCLGYLSIPIGALGILFAVLCRRKGQALPRSCKTGLVLSIAGLAIGMAMLALTVYSTITNPTFWEYMRDAYTQYEQMYQELYGAAPDGYGNL